MQVSDALNAQIGFTLFDAWLNAVHGRQHHGKHGKIASPLVDAAFKAFDHYVASVEVEHNALIASTGMQLGDNAMASLGTATLGGEGAAGLGGYSLNAQGTGVISTKEMAPFLALNLMA